MKVLQVIDILNRGGAERVLVDLSNLLHNNGHKVGVLTLLNEGPLATELNSEIVKLNLRRNNKYSIRVAKKFMTITNEYDVIHLHMRHVLRYYFFCNLFFSTKARVVFHDHWGDIDFDKSVPIYLRWLRNKIYYVGVSRHLVSWAKDFARMDKNRIFLLPNIVVMDFKHQKNQSFGKRILMISNFRRTKNIEFALEVMHELTKHTSATLDVYGRDQDLNYLEELKLLARKLEVDGYVNFIINTPAREKISNYDVAIHTAISETGPLVLIEYLANQLPFISFITGEVSEQLQSSLPLYFKHNFDIKDWSNGLRLHLEGIASYPTPLLKELFETHYSAESYIRSCEKIYNEILSYDKQ